MEDLASLQLSLTMPMRFAGLVLENTNRCTAKCGMCYQSAGPKGSDVLGKAHLDRDVMKRVIREARSVPTLSPRFHLAGGEAFMAMPECLDLYRTARDAGYLDITGTTNAFWARSEAAARDIVTELRGAGVTSLEISWDYWHMPWIKPAAIGLAIEACYDADIETNLRILTTKSHDVDEALAAIPRDQLALVSRMTSGPVFATGRAAETIDPADFHDCGGGLTGACHSTLNLTINSFGNVFPCCAGFDQTNGYLFGNVKEESIVDIADRINNDPIARLIVFRGISKLLAILERQSISIGGNAKGICELCWTIFSSAEAVAAIRSHSAEVQERALMRIAQSLELIDAG